MLESGAEYRGVLVYERVASRDEKSYPGAIALASFVRETYFPIVTAGTPDFSKLKFQLSFSYFAFGGDFLTGTSVQPSFPLELDDCYIARLFVQNEEFVPATSGVTFSSPPGTAVTNLESAFRYLQDGGVYFETPCLDSPAKTLPGTWTVGYNDYPVSFQVPDARPVDRLLLPAPVVSLDGSLLRRLDWTYYDARGNRLARPSSYVTNQVVELFNPSNFSVYLSSNLPPSVSSLTFKDPLVWTNIYRVSIAYQDNLGNWYGLEFDHYPPPGLSIANDRLPTGALSDPYFAQLVAANGEPPYRWSIDGALPPGLKLDSVKGVISGIPEERGRFHFGVRVDDSTQNFEYEQYYVTITTNGPPVILEPPRGGDVSLGDFTYFEVGAEGSQPLAYQWFFEGQALKGETNDTLQLVDITTAQAGLYSVQVSNALGSVTSKPVPLAVLQPPVILTQPASQEVKPGTDVRLTVEVKSAPPIFYQWRRNGETIEGATNSTYTILNAQPQDAGAYDVLVVGPEGFAASDDAVLGFLVENLALTNRFANRIEITDASGLARGSNGGANREPGEPVHAGVPGGSSVWITWVAPASGIATFTTRGSDFDTLLAVYTGEAVDQLTEIVSDDDGAEFFASEVRFNAAAGQRYQIAIDGVYGTQGQILLNWSLDSTGPRLPEILRQPVDSIVLRGGTATFSLQATNPPPAKGPLTYQWYFNGLSIPGATNDTLQILSVDEPRLGLYFATVANESEFVLSDLVVIEISSDPEVIDRRISTEDKFANLSLQTNGLLSLGFDFAEPRPLVASGGVARGFTGSQVFSTTASTTEAGEPNHCGIVGGASQWFSYLAVTNGFLVIDTDGSDFDTVLTVYTGSELSFASLNEIACDNNGGLDGQDSRVAFPAIAGTLYLIVVDGVMGATGTAHLNYRLNLPPTLSATRVNQQLQFSLNGAPGGHFVIESSSNLHNWLPLITTNAPTGAFQWSSRQTSAAQFYRGQQVY